MHPPDAPLPRVIDAIAFAAHAHRHQRRKDSALTPYINHPLALVHVLAVEAGIDDPTVLCAAALHDVLEDCCGGPDHGEPTLAEARIQLRQRFGPAVLALVDAVTDDKTLPPAQRKRLQVEHAAHSPHGARLVKLADKVCNLRDLAAMPPPAWDLQRRRDYFDWAASVVAPMRGTHPVLESLFQTAQSARP